MQNDIVRVVVYPANHLANVLTNKTKRYRKIPNSTQLSKQLNTINKIYDPRSGNEAARFGGILSMPLGTKNQTKNAIYLVLLIELLHSKTACSRVNRVTRANQRIQWLSSNESKAKTIKQYNIKLRPFLKRQLTLTNHDSDKPVKFSL